MPPDLLRLLLQPLARVSVALARLDERLAHSPAGAGLIERFHFADACSSLWLDGELVEMEDLVLHEAARDIRSPSHALTIARDVLQTRRRIVAQPPDWALSANGLRSLRQAGPAAFVGDDGLDLPGIDLDAIDAVLARSETVLAKMKEPEWLPRREADPLIRDPDWDEAERLEQWRTVLRSMPGTSLRSCSAPPGLAVCWRHRYSGAKG